MKPVVLLAASLQRGGAERQLAALAKGLKQRGREVKVVVYNGAGAFDQEIIDAGVEIVYIKNWGRFDPFLLFRLITTLRRLQPAVIYSLLRVPNILSALAAFFVRGRFGRKCFGRKCKLIWGVRNIDLGADYLSFLQSCAQKIEIALSRFADLIISNSHAGMQGAKAAGFPSERIQVIYNGIDTDRFAFDDEGRERVRAEWGVEANERLIGIVARVDPMKDHPNFLRACALLFKRRGDLRFAVIGGGSEAEFAALKTVAENCGLTGVIWAGARNDIPAVFSALDISVSSSWSESFSNVIAESMSCGCPCVVTDIADSARIVGALGVVVPPKNSAALANGVEQMLTRLQTETLLKQQIRSRVIEHFSLETMVARTEAMVC